MTARTDKNLLAKGLQKMGFALVLCPIGPIILHASFKNQDHPLYIPIMLLGIIIMATAIFMGFKGLKTIGNALFNNKNK